MKPEVELRHLENGYDVITVSDGLIWTKFGRQMRNDMPVMIQMWKSKPEVELQRGGRFFSETGICSISIMDRRSVFPATKIRRAVIFPAANSAMGGGWGVYSCLSIIANNDQWQRRKQCGSENSPWCRISNKMSALYGLFFKLQLNNTKTFTTVACIISCCCIGLFVCLFCHCLSL